MADRGAKYADKALSKIDKALQSTYRTASRELSKKLADFNRAFAVKDKEKRKKRDNGEITEKDYQDWLGGQVFMRKQWESKVKQVNEVMLHHNEQAVRIINESSFDVFAENYYAEAFKSQWICQNISFNVYNSQAIARLIKENPQLLPEWKIDEKKDYTWNYKKVNNIVQQGIIQGESVEQIAQRLCRDLSSMNENKMRMFARTAITCGQNAGRHLQMEEAAKLDIEQEKRWTATLDGHTRDSHRAMDGETVPWNKPYSNKLMFPGDPNGSPEEVYNCRCTEETIYPQYEDRQKDWREDETIDGVPYEVWKQGKKAAKDWQKGQEQPEETDNKPLYYAPIDDMGGMSDEQKDTINNRFIELDKKYHAIVDGGVHGLLERDQTEYDLQFENYRDHLLEENPKMRKSTAEKRTLEIMGNRPEYTPGHGSMKYLERGGEYRDKDNLYTMYQNRDNWQDFRHTITINPYSIGASNTLDEDISERREFAARNAQRIAEGRTIRSQSNVGMSLEGTFIHEYGHAIDYTYGVSENPVFRSFYESLSPDDIQSVSRYAETNEREFIAEAFCESFMGDTQGDISKRFMKILEGIINDKH